jgi:pimeloyl-ACP methyl ester carboxylesterase
MVSAKMISQINLSKKSIRYSDQGKGPVVVLLHGYLESLEIWDEFRQGLAKKFRVIALDIPGHGESDVLEEKHSMVLLANTIQSFLKEIKVGQCFMIGHSMGGYVTLMFHQLYPEMLMGFCLFHSHPFADKEDTRTKRLREIDFVKNGKKDLIAKVNIPNAFANKNLDVLKSAVDKAIQIALKAPKNGIIANLHAMMDRPDLSKSLSKSKIPFLLIAGKNDNYIDYTSVVSKIRLPKLGLMATLEKSGHMGFIEEKDNSLEIIQQFINKLKQ